MGEAELYAGRRREADDVMNLNQINSQRQLLRVFGGLNEGYACSEAELSEEKNFSSRGYPALETRKPRRKVREAAGLNGMYHLNGLLTVEGTTLRYAPDDGSAAVELKGALSDNEKRLVGIGTKVLIWPDKMSFDTVSGTLSALGSSWQQGGVSLTVTPCDAAGVVYTPNLFGATEPESPENGDVWLKQAEDAPWSYRDALKLYSTAGGWQNILLNYCRVTCKGLGEAFKAGDTVTLTGIPSVVKNAYSSDFSGDVVVDDVAGDSVILSIAPDIESVLYYGTCVVTGQSVVWTAMDGKTTQTFDGPFPDVTAQRRVPDLDWLTEHNNRVWGCSSTENVIYACKLGDATNWFSYRGTAADSYAVTVGSDGAFTGAATCMGYVLFFKENGLHKLYGTKPSDYQMSSIQCSGVAKGAHQALKDILTETKFYYTPGYSGSGSSYTGSHTVTTLSRKVFLPSCYEFGFESYGYTSASSPKYYHLEGSTFADAKKLALALLAADAETAGSVPNTYFHFCLWTRTPVLNDYGSGLTGSALKEYLYKCAEAVWAQMLTAPDKLNWGGYKVNEPENMSWPDLYRCWTHPCFTLPGNTVIDAKGNIVEVREE